MLQTLRLALPVAVVTLASCASIASIGLKQDLQAQFDELSGLRQGLEADWAALGAELEATERDVAAFTTPNSSVASVDVDVYRRVVLGMDEAQVIQAAASVDGDDVAAATAAVSSKVAALDAQTRGELEALAVERRRLSARLTSDLPGELVSMAKSVANVAARAAAIQATADQLAPVAEDNPLMTAEDLTRMRANRSAIGAELESLTALSDKIIKDSQSYSTRLTNAATQFGGVGQ